MIININQTVKFKLTDHGKFIAESQIGKKFNLQTDNEGFYKWSMWVFANVFGDYLYNGSRQIIENNEIITVKER